MTDESHPAAAEPDRIQGGKGPGTARRVLVLASADGDAQAVVHVLGAAGFNSHICPDISSVACEIARDGDATAGQIGTVIIAQEAIIPAADREYTQFAAAIAHQPRWSDIPLILLAGGTAGEDGAWEIARRLDPVGNIAILERPLRRTTLLNAVTVALRARDRQYELRATLIELADHREHLQRLVIQRTAELSASTASLHASERLASLGTLAAGLGHDLANLTLPIRIRLDTLRRACPDGDAREDIDAIGVSLTHLSDLSAGMRLMALDPQREGASAPATDLTAWAAETAPMLRAVLPRQVRMDCIIAPGLGVGVPRHQLAQAVFNLVQNSGEALAGQSSGVVRIDAAPAHTPPGAPVVRLRVSDNGPGMTPEVLARCFEPYFSTKGRAISTGMGLGMVKGIVEAAGGTVVINSAPGAGTTFTITLPAPSGEDHPPPVRRSTRTGAISVANERTAALTRMFMEQLDIECVRHGGSDTPSAALWVLDNPDPESVASYLEQDQHRRVVVLDGLDQGRFGRAQWRDRVVALPETPTAGALRDALASTCPPAEAAGREA